MDGFDIYFRGELMPDTDPAQVRDGVSRLFKIDPAKTERLFSGQPVRVKSNVDVETAGRYRARFRDAGALVEIVPTGAAAPPALAATTPSAPAAADTPDKPATDTTIAEPALADVGAILDESPSPARADIDTGALEALPPNTGTLADCRQEKPPRKIPDISHLRLVDD